MGLNLAVLSGDGVGSAVATQALDVLDAVGEKLDHSLNFNARLVGGVAIDTQAKLSALRPCI